MNILSDLMKLRADSSLSETLGEPTSDGYSHPRLHKEEIDRLEDKLDRLTTLSEQMAIILEDLDESKVFDEILHDMPGYKVHHLMKKAGADMSYLRAANKLLGQLHETLEEMHMVTMTSLKNDLHDDDEDDTR